MLQRIRDKCSE